MRRQGLTVYRLHREDYYAATKSIIRSVPHPFFGKAIKIPIIDPMRRTGPSDEYILLRACSDCDARRRSIDGHLDGFHDVSSQRIPSTTRKETHESNLFRIHAEPGKEN